MKYIASVKYDGELMTIERETEKYCNECARKAREEIEKRTITETETVETEQETKQETYIPISKIPDTTINYIFSNKTKKPVVKVSWSGGKDSTCAVIQHTLAKHKCEIVTYIPELITGVPLISKEHKDFIYETALLFRSWGHNVHILHGVSESKIKTLNDFKCDFDYEDICIVYDDVKRQNQLTGLKRSILVENHITEETARYICKKYGVLLSHYKHSTCDGCVICPKL